MASRLSAKQCLMLGTTLVGVGALIVPTAAKADCLADASGTTVTCTIADPDGFDGSAVNGLTINVDNGAVVNGTLLSGTDSAVNNEGEVDVGAGNTAIDVLGGTRVSNASTATGDITGNIIFGSTTGSQVNILENFNSVFGITGDISSAGALDATNTGTITGNLDSSGNTTIDNSGTLTGDITLGGGNDTIDNTGTLTGNVDMGAGTNVFDANAGAAFPSGTLTADPAGDSTLNLGTGGGTVGAVTNFDVMNVDAGVGVTWSLIAPVSFSEQINVNSGLLATPDANFLGANTIVNNATTVSLEGVWFQSIAAGTYSGNMSGAGVVYVGFAGAAVTTFSGSNTYTGTTFIQGATLQVTGGSALADDGEVQIGAGGILDVAATEEIGTLNDGLFFGGAGMITLSGGDLLINDGAFSGVITGANGIDKVGTGTLVLSGANTFTGDATVSDGNLTLQGGAAIADLTAVVVNTPGVLQVDAAEVIGSLAGDGSTVLNAGLTAGGNDSSTTFSGVISGVGSLTKEGTGTFTLLGANTYSGGTTVNNGTLEGDSTSLQGDILINAAGTLLFTQPTGGTYAGDLTGTGVLTKDGAGTLTLTGTNNGFSGTTNFNAGAISIGSDTNIGTGPLVFDGGTLQTTGVLSLANLITLNAGGGTFQTDADTTLTGVISGAGDLAKTGTADLILTGANTYTGITTISDGALVLQAGAVNGVSDIVNDADLVFDDAVGGTYSGDISGSGDLTKINTGTTTLTGNNTYTGATSILDGILAVGPTGIGDTSAVTVTTPGTLQLNADETIGSLAGDGTVGGAFTLTTGGNNSTTTFSGDLNNIAGLVKVGTGTFNLTGTGTLTNGFDVSAGTLAIGGVYTAPMNTVASGATLNVLLAGDLTGSISGGAGSTTIINGLVTGDVANLGDLSGNGTVVGNVVNGGTLSPGDDGPGIFNINGSYTQTAAGTLAIEILASDAPVAGVDFDQVLVTGAPGTAALDGTLALDVSDAGSAPYVDGTTYDILIADGGISGDFATISGTELSPFISFDPSIVTIAGTQEAYRLTVDRTDFSVGIGAGATPNQIAVANGFQNLVDGATGDAASLVAAVDIMTADQARLFFDQASPEPYGAYGRALLDQGELFTRQVHLQMHETTNHLPGGNLWGRAYGQWGNGDNDKFRFGSDQDTWGFAIGGDYQWDNFFIGAAGGWSKDKVDYALGNSDGDSKSWQLGVYGGYRAGEFSADLQVAYINGSIDASRSINVATVVRDASASTDSKMWKVIGTVGYDFNLASMILRPFIGIDWSTGSVDGFVEEGAGAANLTVEKIDADRTDLMVGIDLAANPNSSLSPYGRLVWRHNLDNQNGGITAFFDGNPASAFTISAVTPGDDQIDLDAGLNYAINPSFSIYAGYEGMFREDLTSHGFSAGLRYAFGAAPPPPPPPPAPPPPPPPPPPETQTCPDGSVVLATETCPVPPPPPPPPPPAPERG